MLSVCFFFFTCIFLFPLQHEKELPKVVGAAAAVKADDGNYGILCYVLRSTHLINTGSALCLALDRILDTWKVMGRIYCIPGNFSDVKTLANLAIHSFSLKLQVANLVLHCNTSTSIKLCTMKNAKIAKIISR